MMIQIKNEMFLEESTVKPQLITIGGSYPGALSAWFKVMYPWLVDIAYSSSGVIEPIKWFKDFDQNVYTALN